MLPPAGASASDKRAGRAELPCWHAAAADQSLLMPNMRTLCMLLILAMVSTTTTWRGRQGASGDRSRGGKGASGGT